MFYEEENALNMLKHAHRKSMLHVVKNILSSSFSRYYEIPVYSVLEETSHLNNAT